MTIRLSRAILAASAWTACLSILPILAATGQAQPPADATARCKDGTYSKSQAVQGTCSGHGGVAQWLAPSDATARCADHTYSKSERLQGTCASHGGVDEWLATAVCQDGTLWRSQSHQGACSGRGGVAEWFEDDEEAAPVIKTPPANNSDYIATMSSDLRNLVTAEEVFFADSVKYTTKIGPGGLSYQVSPGNTKPRIRLTPDGWTAIIGNNNTPTRCAIFVGATRIAPATKEGEPRCQ